MRRVVLVFLFFTPFLFASPSLPEAEFLSPFYERPDLGQLDSRLAELRVQSNLHALLATHLIEFHLYLLAIESGRPHLAARALSSVARSCDHWSQQTFSTFLTAPDLMTRAGYLCAWVAAEQMDKASWGRISIYERVDKCLVLARRGTFPDQERSYLESRIQLALPPGYAQDTRKALVQLTFLAAQYPNHRGIKESLALAHYDNGNFQASRAKGVEISRNTLDRSEFGIAPGLFATPADGVGLVLQGRDERLFDQARRLIGSISATTRASFRTDLDYQDEEVFSGSTLKAGFSFAREFRDFFSLGISSTEASRTRNLQTNMSGLVSGLVEIVSPITLEVGWFGENQHVEEAPFAVDMIFGSRAFSYSGPFAEIRLDTRDSRRDPFRGIDVSVRGLFPAAGLGSSVTFERWDFAASYYAMLSRAHHLEFHASLASTGVAAPLSVYPVLGGRARVPGVRADRFRDQKSVVAFGEYQLHSLGAFRVAAFGVAGNVGPTLDKLVSGSIGMGGGIALLVQNSRHRAIPLRIELGTFKGEWVFQALATVGF